MANRTLGVLGSAARAARSAGLGRLLAAARDGADAAFTRTGAPPLALSLDGLRVRGFLRHRSFLADAARPGRTYRGLFTRALKQGMTVVDGGAHVGIYTVLAADGVGPSGRVLAFEPDPYNLRALEFNTRGRANVRLVPKALAEAPRQAIFHVSGGTIGSSLIPRGDRIAERLVEVTSIDSELAGVELSSLLVKLNVEGAEPLVLEGMRETARRCDDVTLFVEVAPELLGERAATLVAQIEELGFEVFSIRLADQSLTRVGPETPLSKGHLLARRS